MTIYYIDEIPRNSFYDRKLPNGKYRYEGHRHGVKYCIDSLSIKTEKQIYDILDSFSIDFLLDNEGYIINIR